MNVTRHHVRNKIITRRKVLQMFGCAGISIIATGACRSNAIETGFEDVMNENGGQKNDAKAAKQGRLVSRPLDTPTKTIKTGQHSLTIAEKREVLLYVPKTYDPKKPSPLALMFHGAGGSAKHGLSLLQSVADSSGIIVLSPKSKASTWDVIADDYGADVQLIDEALKYTFEHCRIDKSQVAIGGFSDGASYALSLGITNGELFSHVIAYSPGFMAPNGQTGKPRFYISHGTGDRVLPIERCSRQIVPKLKRAGYEVNYKEFESPHTIPPAIIRESVEWFTK